VLADLYGDDDLSVVTAALVRVRAAEDLDAVRDGGDAPPTDTQLAMASRDQLYRLVQRHDVPEAVIDDPQ
jgi:hypothetical protein